MTNTTPIGVTRVPGFAEALNIIERLIDKAARQCGFDRAELRRINGGIPLATKDDALAKAARRMGVILFPTA